MWALSSSTGFSSARKCRTARQALRQPNLPAEPATSSARGTLGAHSHAPPIPACCSASDEMDFELYFIACSFSQSFRRSERLVFDCQTTDCQTTSASTAHALRIVLITVPRVGQRFEWLFALYTAAKAGIELGQLISEGQSLPSAPTCKQDPRRSA